MKIQTIFLAHKGNYGTRRIASQLQGTGCPAGRYLIRKTLRQADLQAFQPKSFVPRTTDSRHGKRNSPNLLLDTAGNRLFIAQVPNQVWVSDMDLQQRLHLGSLICLSQMALFTTWLPGWTYFPA